MNMSENIGRYLSFRLEKAFPDQLRKMTMNELKLDPHNLSTLNTILMEAGDEYDCPLHELRRKVSTKFYRAKLENSSNNLNYFKSASSKREMIPARSNSAEKKKTNRSEPARKGAKKIKIDPSFKKLFGQKMKKYMHRHDQK